MEVSVLHSFLWCLVSLQLDMVIPEFQVLENVSGITTSSSPQATQCSWGRSCFLLSSPCWLCLLLERSIAFWVLLMWQFSLDCCIIVPFSYYPQTLCSAESPYLISESLLVIRWFSDLGTYKSLLWVAARNMMLNRCWKFFRTKLQSCDSLSNTEWTKTRIWKQRRFNNTLFMSGISLQSLDKYDFSLASLAQFSWGPNYNLLAAACASVRLLQLTAAEPSPGQRASSSEFADVLVLCLSSANLK